jgi:carbon monoxide dehydrogenase subunit G
VRFRAADCRDALEVKMTTIRKEIRIDAPVDRVWDALRDVGALHTKLVPGFVKDTRMEGNTRVVTFGNDMVAREDIVSIDPAQHRVAWAVVGQQFRHYNGAAWVESDPKGGSRFYWTADLLPDEFAPQVDEMMTAGIEVVKRTLEAPTHAA